MTVVAVDVRAQDRLAQLGLSQDLIVRALLRADAEAKMSNDLEPPTAEGTTRYIKTVRFLREETIPLGWSYDNTSNFCRTIHPSGQFAIVTSSGDTETGVYVPGRSPSTKYPKGDLTVRAVETNAQLALDLGVEYEAEATMPLDDPETVWYLLQRATHDLIYAELSLPTMIDQGVISDWDERIILPPTSRHEPPPVVTIEEPPGDDERYSVDVAMR